MLGKLLGRGSKYDARQIAEPLFQRVPAILNIARR